MSCFIVSPDTIDRILSTIELQGGWARHAARLPASYLYDWNALGRAMLDLNAGWAWATVSPTTTPTSARRTSGKGAT